MNAPDSTPPRDLETAVSEINGLAASITEYVDKALRNEPGSGYRDDAANDALADLEELESVIRDARKAIEALP